MREQRTDYLKIQKKLNEFLIENHLTINEIEQDYIILQKRLINLLSIAERAAEGNFIEETEFQLLEIHRMVKFLSNMKSVLLHPNDKELTNFAIKKVEQYFDKPELDNFVNNLRDSIIDMQYTLFSLMRISEDYEEASNLIPINDCLISINMTAFFFFDNEKELFNAA